jgi:hypothetical protein
MGTSPLSRGHGLIPMGTVHHERRAKRSITDGPLQGTVCWVVAARETNRDDSRLLDYLSRQLRKSTRGRPASWTGPYGRAPYQAVKRI